MVTAESIHSSMTTSGLRVWRSTFSTSTSTITLAAGISWPCDQLASHSSTKSREPRRLLGRWGSSMRARRRGEAPGTSEANAASRSAYTDTWRVTPARLIRSATSARGQTNRIGISGQVLTYQRALVNTDHAEDAGTSRPLTSTTTACGSSSAALITRSRRAR
ncbi:hypothetical protein ACT18_16705 [Mycolicibacter kumamotonensis]|uniref:Uncharacterized protein n=1 Tax=Mycolicibacter kumamotonensis TaxID=354243 RepID=A0A1B8SCX3_9MYCO|nr:hypothetical protein ACT18_16705 [Mycolicibacter kumamotonensis]